MPEKSDNDSRKDEKSSERAGVIAAITTRLKFYALVTLVVEATLGALFLQADGSIKIIALCSMVLIILLLIVLVWFEPVESGSNKELGKFMKTLTGYWWERVTPAESNNSTAISHIEFVIDHKNMVIKMIGRGFNIQGDHIANWETQATCINLNERKLYFKWQGRHPLRPNEPYEGFGEITFTSDEKKINRGTGIFVDVNLLNPGSTTTKSIEFFRCPAQDTDVMQSLNRSAIAKIIKDLLNN